MRTTFEFGTHETLGLTPLRIVVAGDWCCGGESNNPVRIDKDNFQHILKACAGELVFEVPNHLSSHPDKLLIRLQIDRLNSFSPAGLAAKVPELQRALNLREQLAALACSELDYAEFASGLDAYKGLDAFANPLRLCEEARQVTPDKTSVQIPEEHSPAPESHVANTEDNAVDRILDMVDDQKVNTTPAAVSQLQQVISSIGTSSKSTATHPGYTAAVTAAEDILSRQFEEILHHPRLQACEALWSGMKFLVDRTDFRKDIHIELFAIERERFGDSFHERILAHEHTGQADIPLGLVIMPFAIDNHPSDLEQLQLLGEAAGELQVPVLISASPAFFQLDSGSEASAMPYPGGLLSRPEYDKWNALRDKDAARWLTVCFNRFLLRSPYTAQHRHSAGLAETIHRPDDYLWGEPAWILASLITASFARCDWPTEITGMDHGQVAGLPLHHLTKPDEQEMQIPLEALLSGQLAEDLAASGFTPLICKPNRDSAYVLWAPMLHRPEIYDDAAATAASRAMAHLPYQLLASRISETVASNLPRLRAASLSAEDLGNVIGHLLQQLVANTGAGAGVTVKVHTEADESGKRQVDLEIHTGREVLNGANVQLSFLA
jgi:type VI secretion system ImpC/EvpB family protein/type VI secretion system ImpB/VipA family protein